MTLEEKILGAVLVGGESRRMGRDKALLEVEGRPLAERVADVVGRVVPRVVLVARDGTDRRFPGRSIIADRFPGRGPVAGLHAALVEAEGGSVFLAACDLPGLSPELVQWVIGSEPLSETVPSARVPVADGRLQPLCALYGPACVVPAEAALQAGSPSMHAFLDRLDVARLPFDPELPFYHPDLLANWNEPDDLPRRPP